MKKKVIYLSNHAGANGPMTYEMVFPVTVTPWGAHEMCEGIKSRWNYLYHVFYRQKLHWEKFKAFVVATLFCPISLLLYKGVGLIPAHQDTRFFVSLKKSCQILDKDSAILIFPEDSSDGYKNPPKVLLNGFVALAKVYHKRKGESVPVYSCYFGAKEHKLVISNPLDVIEMLNSGLSEAEIARKFADITKELYYSYINTDENSNNSDKIPQ